MTENVITNEIWKNIEDFPDYQVSNFGRVKSFKLGKEKILKLSNDRDGYKFVRFHNSKGYKNFKVHRLVAHVFIPNPDNLPIINHKNEIKSDNRVENLEWCTNRYNINYGTCRQKISEGNKGKKIPLEICKKMSDALKGEKNPNFGKHCSLETRQKISQKLKKTFQNLELRKKISEKLKGENSPNYGKHLSLQHRMNIGKGNKGKRGIPVNQYTLDMIFVKRYNSISDAASTLNIDCTGICDCCKGRRKSAVGFIWKYANE